MVSQDVADQEAAQKVLFDKFVEAYTALGVFTTEENVDNPLQLNNTQSQPNLVHSLIDIGINEEVAEQLGRMHIEFMVAHLQANKIDRKMFKYVKEHLTINQYNAFTAFKNRMVDEQTIFDKED